MPRKRFLKEFSGCKWEPVQNLHEQRPRTAALIGQCVSSWSQVEAQEAILLGLLFEAANTEATMAAFLQVHNAGVQRRMIEAAGAEKLKSDEIQMLRALTDVIKTMGTERNHIAHGVWGVCPDLKDGAVWLEAKDLAPFGVNAFYGVISGDQSRTDFALLDDRLFFYRDEDLEAHLSDFNQLWGMIVRFLAYLTKNSGYGTNEQLFDQLSRWPPIAASLLRRSANS
jgi:hypothetical protein